MKNKLSVEEELSEIAPLLSKNRIKKTFQVPVDYFQTLEDEVWKQVSAEAKIVPVEKRSFFVQIEDFIASLFTPKHNLKLAGLAVVIIGAALFLFKPQVSPSTSILLADISSEEINDYIESNIADYDVEFLADYMAEESIEIEEVLLFELNDQEMDDFLEDIFDDLELDEIEELL